jgi:hypothetical protein
MCSSGEGSVVFEMGDHHIGSPMREVASSTMSTTPSPFAHAAGYTVSSYPPTTTVSSSSPSYDHSKT